MKRGLLVLAAALMTLAPMSASAAIGGVVVVGRPYAFSWYGYPGPYYPYLNSGEIKVDTKVKNAQVFINGAYAGTTRENKTMHLRQGTYHIEIREGGQTHFSQQVYVAVGKTLHLHPEL